MKKLNKLGLWIGATLMAMPMVAFGAPIDPNTGSSGSSISTLQGLFDKANEFIGYFVAVVAIIAVAMIVWGGLLYAQGDADNGRGKVTAGVIGLVIALLAYSIVKIVISLF